MIICCFAVTLKKTKFRLKLKVSLFVIILLSQCISALIPNFFLVYNNEDDVYVHHEIYLGAFPVCMEHITDLGDSKKVNYLAIGDMAEDINVWDLDLVDALDPAILLKGHSDSVLDLSWNKIKKNLLISVSADKTARLWDLTKKKQTRKFDFKAIPQSVQFHPLDPTIFLTGDSESNALVIDISNGHSKKWVCEDEIEKVLWDKGNSSHFFVGTSTG